ncbi:PREDICTED: THAP domain-containing protein 4-like isoform X2 [Trachymyrmex cornetzi]|uniref:THAP domain-containing protein 4-like isoform X2 n=1 Tax=Trachymyrmex cornetzi TaxID=471704 RepID=UPI00084F2631|nr:PREDICTED: THAP domain-containing protein 4-like isoform X2 [Trachymyrmex cornetzi]
MPGCAAVNCSNRVDKGYRLFSFPEDKRGTKWVHNMRRDKWTPTTFSRLCEVHFEDSQFEAHPALMAGENLNRMQSQRFSMCPPPRHESTHLDENHCTRIVIKTQCLLK